MPPTASPATAPSKSTAPWLDAWFPVAFCVDLPRGAPRRVEVHGRGFVLFHDRDGRVRALDDVCPHRAARLSDGRVCDGRVECLYHGWQFDGEGRCARIPQLGPGQAMPAAATLRAIPVVERHGIVWLHAGDRDEADALRSAPPHWPELDEPGVRSIDFAIDLPYDHEFLIENVLDYAHIHIAHDGVRGGGHGALAGPLAFELGESGPNGFAGRFGRATERGLELAPGIEEATMAFRAPCLVHYRTIRRQGPDGRRPVDGLMLYALPLGPGACRLLYRAYSNLWPLRDRLRPRFLEHGYQCHLLEQDLAVVRGQVQNLLADPQSLGRRWLPLKTSDTSVIAYRAWLDEHAQGRPGYLGLRTRGDAVPLPEPTAVDRWTAHVRQCSSCSRALRAAARVQSTSRIAAFVGLAAAAATSGGIAIALASAACATAGVGLAAARMRRRLLGARRWADLEQSTS